MRLATTSGPDTAERRRVGVQVMSWLYRKKNERDKVDSARTFKHLADLDIIILVAWHRTQTRRKKLHNVGSCVKH